MAQVGIEPMQWPVTIMIYTAQSICRCMAMLEKMARVYIEVPVHGDY